MLAGSMKLKHFLLGAGLLVVLAGVAVGAYVWGDDPPAVDRPAEVLATPAAVAAPQLPVVAAPRPVDPATPGLREVDAVVLSYRGKDLGSDKLKDVTSGKPYKVNVYQDAGQSTANRAKVDLDRDDKWDEKFTFEADEIRRDVAPADDERYTQHYRWDGGAWAADGG